MTVKIFVATFVLLLCFYYTIKYIKIFFFVKKFYKDNSFETNCQFLPEMYYGDPPEPSTKMTNRQKLYFGIPFQIIFNVVVMVVCAAIIYGELANVSA